MSANLDLVRSISAELSRGEFSPAEWAHPEIEYVNVDGLVPRSMTGVAELNVGWSDYGAAWEDSGAEVQEYREVDGERALVLLNRRGRGKTSGVTLYAKGAEVFHIRNGKVTKAFWCWGRDRALANLGLGPESGSAARRA